MIPGMYYRVVHDLFGFAREADGEDHRFNAGAVVQFNYWEIEGKKAVIDEDFVFQFTGPSRFSFNLELIAPLEALAHAVEVPENSEGQDL